MEKEISKGTQKFIWHMVSFVAVFIIALVVLCRFLPEPNRTATADSNLQVSTSQIWSLISSICIFIPPVFTDITPRQTCLTRIFTNLLS